jgi:hypothetical protein
LGFGFVIAPFRGSRGHVLKDHYGHIGRVPIPVGGSTFGARPAIGAEFEQRGLRRFGLGPRLELLTAQFAQAPPTESVPPRLREDRL